MAHERDQRTQIHKEAETQYILIMVTEEVSDIFASPLFESNQ